jgi:hypothetical protein
MMNSGEPITGKGRWLRAAGSLDIVSPDKFSDKKWL